MYMYYRDFMVVVVRSRYPANHCKVIVQFVPWHHSSQVYFRILFKRAGQISSSKLHGWTNSNLGDNPILKAMIILLLMQLSKKQWNGSVQTLNMPDDKLLPLGNCNHLDHKTIVQQSVVILPVLLSIYC